MASVLEKEGLRMSEEEAKRRKKIDAKMISKADIVEGKGRDYAEELRKRAEEIKALKAQKEKTGGSSEKKSSSATVKKEEKSSSSSSSSSSSASEDEDDDEDDDSFKPGDEDSESDDGENSFSKFEEMMEKIPADKRFGTKTIIDKLFVDGEERKNFASMSQGLSITRDMYEKYKDSPAKVASIKVVEGVFTEFRSKHEKKDRVKKRSLSVSSVSDVDEEEEEEDEDEEEEEEEYADEVDDEEEEDEDENASMDASEGSIERENIEAELEILDEVEKEYNGGVSDFIDLEAEGSGGKDEEVMSDEEEEKQRLSKFIDETEEDGDDEDGTMHQRIFNKLEKKKFKNMLGSKVSAIGKLEIKEKNKRAKKDGGDEKSLSKAKKEEEEWINNRISELKEIEESVRPGSNKLDKAESSLEVFKGYIKYVILSLCFARGRPELMPCTRMDIDHFSFIAPDNKLVKTCSNSFFYTLIFLNKCSRTVHRGCMNALKTFRLSVSCTPQHESSTGKIIKLLHAVVNPLTFSVSPNCSAVFTSETSVTALPTLRCEMSGYEGTDASEFSVVRFDVDRSLLVEIEKETHFYSSHDISKHIPVIASSVSVGKPIPKTIIIRSKFVPVIIAYFSVLHFEFVADRIIHEHIPTIDTLNPSYSMVEKMVEDTPKIAESVATQMQWATTILSKTKFTYKQ